MGETSNRSHQHTERDCLLQHSPHRHTERLSATTVHIDTDRHRYGRREEKRLTSTLVPSPLGSLEAASRTAGNTSHDTAHSASGKHFKFLESNANSPRERMVTQFGRSGMRRAWPRALLPVSFLYALAPCVEGERERERERERESSKLRERERTDTLP